MDRVPLPVRGRAPGRQTAPVAPDCMLFLRPIARSRFRSYRTWEVGAPAWVLEILSDDTWENDVDAKRDLYARLGVEEYWFYDPEGVQHEDSAGTLAAFRLRAGVYEAIAPLRHPAAGAVAAVYPSAVLGVALGVDRQRHLRLYDAGRQAWYQTADEAHAEAQAERDARQHAEARLQELLARLPTSDDDELDSPCP